MSDTITIVITDDDWGDVSFQDEYSANVFDNAYSYVQDDCRSGIIDLVRTTDPDWLFYKETRESGNLSHTLKHQLEQHKSKEVVEMLKTIYNVNVVYIEYKLEE